MGQNIHYKEKSIHVHKKQLQFTSLKFSTCVYTRKGLTNLTILIGQRSNVQNLV